MSWMDWYNSLAKPSWTPEPPIIGLIWQVLYPIILVTFGFVFVQGFRGKVPWWVALPFAINLVANLFFTPIQFGNTTATAIGKMKQADAPWWLLSESRAAILAMLVQAK